ncbi:MAG: DUF1330 domain-containing protein [Halioglobus sp.]
MATDSTEQQIEDLMKGPAEGSIRMLNMLKFKDKAEYSDGSDGGCENGMQAYMKYAAALHQGILEAAGAKLVFSESVAHGVIGAEDATDYDVVAIMQYPSRQAFLGMTSSAEYQEAHIHREAGLSHQLLICCAGNESG